MNEEAAIKMANDMADTFKEVKMENPCLEIPTPQLCTPVNDKGLPRDPSQVLYIYYNNWKGEWGWRRVIPLPKPMEFGSPFHPKMWIFRVYDLDKKAERSYSISGCERIVVAWSQLGENLEKDAWVPWPEWKEIPE